VVFSNCWARGLDRSAKFVVIHKEANNRIRHEPRLRETACLTRKPLDPRTQGQMVTFALVCIGFANGVGGGEGTVVAPRRVGIEVDESKGLSNFCNCKNPSSARLPSR